PVILTANYCFLNYLVLALGVLLLDDRFVLGVLPETWRLRISPEASPAEEALTGRTQSGRVRLYWHALGLSFSAGLLRWIIYATTAELIWMFVRAPLLVAPVIALEPFRIANQYGLFAVMTRGRYEIEFQGSMDGENWVAYPFRYKPQDPAQPPRIYAPYQ